MKSPIKGGGFTGKLVRLVRAGEEEQELLTDERFVEQAKQDGWVLPDEAPPSADPATLDPKDILEKATKSLAQVKKEDLLNALAVARQEANPDDTKAVLFDQLKAALASG